MGSRNLHILHHGIKETNMLSVWAVRARAWPPVVSSVVKNYTPSCSRYVWFLFFVVAYISTSRMHV